MFSKTLISQIVLVVSAGATATESVLPEAPVGAANEKGSLVGEHYVDTQLDWRSYYLQRLDRGRAADARDLTSGNPFDSLFVDPKH